MAKAASSAGLSIAGFDILEHPDQLQLKPVYVVFGDEQFLRSAAVDTIRSLVLGSGDEDLALSRIDGNTARLADVLDELAMLPFLSRRRLVVVSSADDFVSAHRDALERYLERPHGSGILLLLAQSWPSNTRLAKALPKCGFAIDCRPATVAQVTPWCRRWVKLKYGKRLSTDAADLLVQLIGVGIGALDCELAKLSAFVGERGEIGTEDVDKLVAGQRVETVWQIIDTALAGNAPAAVRMLRSLLNAGEHPLMVFGALSAQLRRLARCYRLVSNGEAVGPALSKAGVNPYFLQKSQAQLKHLGRDRLARLYGWLLKTDLGQKGDSVLSPQHLLERLIIQISIKPA